jgi:hypothetical protein
MPFRSVLARAHAETIPDLHAHLDTPPRHALQVVIKLDTTGFERDDDGGTAKLEPSDLVAALDERAWCLGVVAESEGEGSSVKDMFLRWGETSPT